MKKVPYLLYLLHEMWMLIK